ncbi:Ig-like domain-containing protein [Desulfobacterales bacterium HSG16]|nr:Ig-like domain-containing protein [Desulfobacterales bacterium HSG16]
MMFNSKPKTLISQPATLSHNLTLSISYRVWFRLALGFVLMTNPGIAVAKVGCAIDLYYITHEYDQMTSLKDIDSIKRAKAGDEIELAVVARNVTDLDTYQFDIEFDADHMIFIEKYEKVADVQGFFEKNGGRMIRMPVIDDVPGVVSIAGTLAGNSEEEAPDGSGIISFLKFKIINDDIDKKISLANVVFLDYRGKKELVTNLTDATIQAADKTRPEVKIESAISDLTNISPIPVTVKFSESVTGFEIFDIIVSNGSIIEFTGSDQEYSFFLTPAEQGRVTIDIPSDAAKDNSGNKNFASHRFSRKYDSIPPFLEINPVSHVFSDESSVQVEIDFSEPITEFDISDIAVSNGTVIGFSGSGAEYSFNIAASGQGNIKIDIPQNIVKDAADNGNIGESRIYFFNHSPEIFGSPALSAEAGKMYEFLPQANESDEEDFISFSIENKPEWAVFNEMTGKLAGMPDKEHIGKYEKILIIATDKYGAESVLPSFDIMVKAVEDPPLQESDDNDLDMDSGNKDEKTKGGSSGCFIKSLFD